MKSTLENGKRGGQVIEFAGTPINRTLRLYMCMCLCLLLQLASYRGIIFYTERRKSNFHICIWSVSSFFLL